MRKIRIAIDGFAGTGKSSTAKAVAKALGYIYIDTGAMYRAVTLYLLDKQIPVDRETSALMEALGNIRLDFRPGKGASLEVYLNDEPAEPAIRHPRVSEAVSPVATLPAVRHALVAQQRRIGEQGGIVMDGRDIGTYVFPDAELKVFMTASLPVRARRRQSEMADAGLEQSLEDIQSNLTARDQIDATREMAPLRQAPDAVVMDTSTMEFEDQVAKILQLVQERCHTTPSR